MKIERKKEKCWLWFEQVREVSGKVHTSQREATQMRWRLRDQKTALSQGQFHSTLHRAKARRCKRKWGFHCAFTPRAQSRSDWLLESSLRNLLWPFLPTASHQGRGFLWLLQRGRCAMRHTRIPPKLHWGLRPKKHLGQEGLGFLDHSEEGCNNSRPPRFFEAESRRG